LSRSHYNLGIVARQTGRPDEAVAELTAAARLLDGVPGDDAVQRRHRARVYLNLGPALRAADRLREAEAACGEALALYDALAAENPARPDFQCERAVALINRGLVRQSAGNPAGARDDLTRADGLLAGLVEKYPSIPQYTAERARAYNARAAVAFDAGEPAEGTALFARAVDVWAGLAAQQDSPDYHGELGIALGNHGRALYQSDPPRARQLLTRGLTELLIGLKANPDHPAFASSFRQQARDLAGLLVGAGDHAGARALARAVAATPPDRVASARRAVTLLAGCVAAAERQQVPAEADGYETLAVELVTAAGPADWSVLRADPDCAALVNRPGFAKAVGK
jgi:tetratricopeptide (TPR) repeat protein